MVRYRAAEVRQRLVGILGGSGMGLSGVEISDRLGISRVTMTKYLNVFAAEGLIRQRSVGNTTLWYVEDGTEQFQFPDDYLQVQKKYQGLLLAYSEGKAHALVRSCLSSDARVARIMTEVVMPTAAAVRRLFDNSKIGYSEMSLLNHVMTDSIRLAGRAAADADPRKNAVLLAADAKSVLACESARAALRADGWNVSMLGDMSASVNVIFDLDLQKFLGKVWKGRSGVMAIVVFSESEEGLNFFAESAGTAKRRIRKDVRLVLCGRAGKKTPVRADLITEDLDEILQWLQTVYESRIG